MKSFPAPRRPAGRLRLRSALTLAETLIALGVLAVGLLGVAAVFPVGGFLAESGDVADRGSAIAQAALSDAVIRGHLDPENWVVHDVNALVVDEGTLQNGLPPELVPQPPQFDIAPQHAFARLVSGETSQTSIVRRLGLRDAVSLSQRPPAGTTAAAVINAFTGGGPPVLFRSRTYGGAFVIDPMGLAGVLNDNTQPATLVTNTTQSSVVRNFPSFAGNEQPSSLAWSPWVLPNPPAQEVARAWPIRRVTTVHGLASLNTPPQGSPETPSFATLDSVARDFFNTTDDLAQFFPESGDEPVRQRWETFTTGGAPLPSVRQSRGDYSWLLSVAPESAEAVDAMTTNPGSFPAEVSAVVFNRRVAARGPQATLEAERLVRARVVSTSPGGGELLLERRPPGDGSPLTEPQASPFTDLRPGEFVMVAGPHPQSTLQNPQFAIRWCRILSIQDSGTAASASVGSQTLDGGQRVLVALRGPDWPWLPAANADLTQLSNDLRVAILPGAVAVHTMTTRLEAGSEWAID